MVVTQLPSRGYYLHNSDLVFNYEPLDPIVYYVLYFICIWF